MSESAGRLPLELPGPGSARLFGDDSLARRAADGDERAFAAIYRRHHQELYRYCRALLNDPDDAQDALQATMVKALRALPGEKREIALKPWLFRVAHNEAISIVRARKPSAALNPEQPDPRLAVEQQAATHERLRELVGDLDALGERQRGSLVMRELNGLGYDEIARVFSITPAAAKQAVYEARVALQEIAEGREMECDLVREAISANDRRVLRGRRIRAHLRGCERCTDFEAAIGRRRTDLAALAPPLALPVAIATLHAVLGGGSAAGAAGAGGVGAFGGGIGGGLAIKAAVAVLATATVAGGAAELSGVIDLGGATSHDSAEQAPAGAQPGSSGSGGAPTIDQPARSVPGTAGEGPSKPAGGHGSRHGSGDGKQGGRSGFAHGNSHGHGQATAPGRSHSNSADSSASATGQANSSSAGSQGSASSQNAGAGASTAPGQAGTSPGQSGTAGNSANAPGHVK